MSNIVKKSIPYINTQYICIISLLALVVNSANRNLSFLLNEWNPPFLVLLLYYLNGGV